MFQRALKHFDARSGSNTVLKSGSTLAAEAEGDRGTPGDILQPRRPRQVCVENRAAGTHQPAQPKDGPSMEDQIRTHLDHKRYGEAFELLLSHYENKVFRLAYAMLGNRALGEETAQEVFVRVWKGLPGYRGQASLSTWIYAIARNACLTARRRQAACPALSLDEPAVRQAAETRNISALRKQTDLESLVALLPEKYRQAVTLFYMEDKSYEEVSRLLDLPMGTVKTYLHRARKDLTAALRRSESNAVR